jgi:hydroxyethylthiazole kinase-like uncharacterized protein yjeF
MLVTNSDILAAEQRAVAAGTSLRTLMENAGRAVANTVLARFPKSKVLVVCGSGNNGGDGLVAARILHEQGWAVDVLCDGASRRSEAADAFAQLPTATKPLNFIANLNLAEYQVIIDAVIGSGLARDVESDLASLFTALSSCSAAVVAVDIPSGVNGDSGQIMGAAVRADITVTWQAPRVGHLLFPGRESTGELVVADVGLDCLPNKLNINEPLLWQGSLPHPTYLSHKYSRGHLLVIGGEMAGAAVLAAMSGQRGPAGIVTLATDNPDCVVPPSIIKCSLAKCDMGYFDAVVVGPGLGRNERTCRIVRSVLESGVKCVIDADALSFFLDEDFYRCVKPGAVVMTPHAGEFSRLFATTDNKLSDTLAASKKSGAAVIFKGADSVIATPEGEAAINNNAPYALSVAGSGDVLAGIIGGLLAAGMDAFAAAAAGTWIHGAAGRQLKCEYLTAEDVISALPGVVNDLVKF